jgi:hypothetical protein
MKFARPMSRRLFAAVALHGIVDLAEPSMFVVYPVCLTIPDRLASPAFVVSSVVHFAQDIGLTASLLLHMVFLLLPPDVAFFVLDCYMLMIHMPLLFVRVCRNPLSLALLFSGVATGTALPMRVCRGMLVEGKVVLRPIHLKIVSAHCLTTLFKYF